MVEPRDLFAGLAMQMLMKQSIDADVVWDPEDIATDAFQQADAMMAARGDVEQADAMTDILNEAVRQGVSVTRISANKMSYGACPKTTNGHHDWHYDVQMGSDRCALCGTERA